LGFGLGLLTQNPPAGLLTKTRPNPLGGYLAGGLGLGRVLARSNWR
jgi:hypothetical protein